MALPSKILGIDRKRGADALVRALVAAKVRRVFTLSGNHIMPVFDAAIGAGVELIHVRHEAAAVHMADAWARITGEVGVALVTGGPGHANAVAALYTASMAESPVVLFSGHAPLGELGMGAFQEMKQAEIAAPLAKESWTSASADSIAGDVERAIASAKGGRPGAVHVSLPSDALEREMGSRPAPGRRAAELPPSFDPEPFLERLKRAKRPLILTGPASMTKAGRQRMAKLEAACGIPVVGMESPRGIADSSLGEFPQMLAQADCILLLGKRLDFTLKFGRAPALAAECEFLQIDAEASETERTRRAAGARLRIAALASPFDAAEAMMPALRKQRIKSAWLGEVRAAIAERPAAWSKAKSKLPGRLHPVQALRPLQAILDSNPESVFVSDGGEFGQWAQACLSAPHRVINGVAGAIGPALPFAVAARIAKPDAPVIAVMGDGTFGFHPAEIDTAVRYKLPFVAIVGNDARWNAEYQIQLREYGAERALGTELLPTRYDEVAKGFGGFGELVTDASKLAAAAKRALASRKPAVLNVMIEGLAAP